MKIKTVEGLLKAYIKSTRIIIAALFFGMTMELFEKAIAGKVDNSKIEVILSIIVAMAAFYTQLFNEMTK